MVRQVLEPRGYRIDAQGLRVRGGTVFSKATRYRLTGAEVVEKLRRDLETIRAKAAADGGSRATVEGELAAALELWTSGRVVYPHLKTRLEVVLNTHERLAPALRVRMLRTPSAA